MTFDSNTVLTTFVSKSVLKKVSISANFGGPDLLMFKLVTKVWTLSA